MKDLNREEEKRRKWRKIFVGRRREKREKEKMENRGKMGKRNGFKAEAGSGGRDGRGKGKEAGIEGKGKGCS